MTALQIRQRLEAMLEFLQPHFDFINCHMVNFITDKHWDHYVPKELRAEISNAAETPNCIKSVFWNAEENQNLCEKYKTFKNFIKESSRHRLKNFDEIVTTVGALHQHLAHEREKSKISIKEFMNEKKRHEVEITSELVDELMQHIQSKNVNCDLYVIDAGDGKGYLSSRLALEYKHKVLGIDANETNTENALERSKKLQRAWNGLTERAKLESEGITPPRRGKKQKSNITTDNSTRNAINYKTTSTFITPDLDLIEVIREHFPNENTSTIPPIICLTGLHTCGNLAPTCIEAFHSQPQCKLLCNIGCCYHLLKEAYSEREFFGNKDLMKMQKTVGFPLSQYLRSKKVQLGRNARMLAAQSIERSLSAKELPSISLFYRALLEVLICERCPELKNTIQVGKIRKFENFSDYVARCSEKLDLLKAIDPERILQFERAYADQKLYLDLFYLLRMTFAPILESLILLDRLLFLKELGYEESFLVPIFDAVISPRHFAIIAIKN